MACGKELLNMAPPVEVNQLGLDLDMPFDDFSEKIKNKIRLSTKLEIRRSYS
jgi:hypothetical protein